MEDRCVICGNIVPEGTDVCPRCYQKWITDTGSAPKKPGRRAKENNKKKKKGERTSVIQ